MSTTIRSVKRKFVADGVFKAEINELLLRSLGDHGFSGIEINITKSTTEVRVVLSSSKYNEMQNAAQNNMLKIRELHGLIEQRFGFKDNPDHKFVLLAKRATHGGLCAQEQAEYLKKRLLMGIPVRSAALNVIRMMDQRGANGTEVIVSGKLRQQRAKSMKFRGGFMVHSGQPRITFIDTAVRHIELRQGIMGVKVRIMLKYVEPSQNSDNRNSPYGIDKPLPDVIKFHVPKTDLPESEARLD